MNHHHLYFGAGDKYEKNMCKRLLGIKMMTESN